MTPSDASPPVIGIDLGGTNMQLGVVDAGNRIVARARRRTHAELGRDAVIDRIVGGVQELAASVNTAVESLSAVGIAAPGAIDIPRGLILEAPNLGWQDTPFRDLLAERLGCRVVLDNDVNGAIWGEYVLGAARGCRNALGVWVGTGVGGGLVVDGKLYHGDFFTAGEIGHTIISIDSQPGAQKLEDHCSRTGMSRLILDRLDQSPLSMLHDIVDRARRVVSSSDLARAYHAGDTVAVDVVEHAARLLGIAIANAVTLLSLERVVIGGGVTEALGQPFIDLIRTSFERNVFPDRCRACRLVMTELADDAGLLGAAMLARTDSPTRIIPR